MCYSQRAYVPRTTYELFLFYHVDPGIKLGSAGLRAPAILQDPLWASWAVPQ